MVFSDGGVSYEIGISEDNQPVVIIKDNILNGVPKKKWVKTVKANMKNKFSKGIPFKGKLFLVNKDTRREYTYSRYSQNIWNTSFYEDKMKASNHLDELIISSINYINEDLNHQRKDSIVQFARGDVNMKIGNHGYEAKIIVGFTKNDELLLYDIIDMIPKNIKIKKDTKTVPVHQQGGSNSSQYVPSGTNISQSNSKSNPSQQNNSDSGNTSDLNGPKSKDDTIYDDFDEDLLSEYKADFSEKPRIAVSVLSPYLPNKVVQEYGAYYGRAIYSKYALSGFQHTYYSNDSNRYISESSIEVGGKRISLIVTHLTVNSREAKQTQLAELKAYLQSLEFFICCGGFNTDERYTEDCFLNTRSNPLPAVDKNNGYPNRVSVILAEDKGFEVLRLVYHIVSLCSTFRYFKPISVYRCFISFHFISH